VSDGREQRQQETDDVQAGDDRRRVDGGDDAHDPHQREPVGAPEQAAVLPTDADRLESACPCTMSSARRSPRRSRARTTDPDRESGDHRDVGVAVEDVIEEVAAVGGDPRWRARARRRRGRASR